MTQPDTSHSTMLELYHWATPVGAAVNIMLEECAVDYRVIPLDITRGDQFSAPFATLSPNGKVPLLVDPHGHDGAPLAVFESGAILLYLARKCGKLLPSDPAQMSLVEQWLFWGISSLGPMVGQNHHFRHYAPEPVPYALARYDGEVRRLYGVLERRLAQASFLAGDYSLADLPIIGWVRLHERHDVSLAQFPHLARWLETMLARPAVAKGLAVGNEAGERRFPT